MPSLDFEIENKEFREFYDSTSKLLEDAKNSFITLLYALIKHGSNVTLAKVEGRVKEKEECIKKFNRKYRSELEAKGEPYSIKDHITDLIGLRVVCLYEDDIEKIHSALSDHFEVIDITDKIALIENTENSFGYKGLHLDLQLNANRNALPEYISYAAFPFEVQVRTIIQDSWSVLDHKIKYKKSIPNRLKRRINTLAALFELADREFREIRDATEAEIKKADEIVVEAEVEPEADQKAPPPTDQNPPLGTASALDAFSFLRIAKHFFASYEFEPHKVDGFTQEICSLSPGITRGKFNYYMKETIGKVKKYQAHIEAKAGKDQIYPFTIIRHCLYLGNKDAFKSLLTNVARESFDNWLSTDEAT